MPTTLGPRVRGDDRDKIRPHGHAACNDERAPRAV